MMQLTTAYNIHNRGSFQIEDTAFKAGNSSQDRQSRGEAYLPYQQGDQLDFRPALATGPSPVVDNSGIASWLGQIANLDIRVYTALIPTVLFAAFFQAISNNTLLSITLSIPFYLVWYVMSFFDFQKFMSNTRYYQAQRQQTHHQVHATF